MPNIREISGLWCDDITFCPKRCGWRSCPRNEQNIRDRLVPHSFSVEIPQDCPKKAGDDDDIMNATISDDMQEITMEGPAKNRKGEMVQ